MTARRAAMLGLCALALVACADHPVTAPEVPTDALTAHTEAGRQALGWLRRALVSSSSGSSGPAVLAGAGDIARCYPGTDVTAFSPPGPNHPAARTARLLDALPGATVMAVGDNAYEFGSTVDYEGCYEPTWGRHRRRTRPAAGNHEYLTPAAAGYFGYFRRRAAPPLGYYSYDLGSWHVVVLNSTPQVYACWPQEANEVPPGFPSRPPPPVPDPAAGEACVGDVAQQAWLVGDLTSHADTRCTVAYFHHPRFSSGKHGNHYQMQRIWRILYRYGVDVVVSAHDHLYERFAPQDPLARVDEPWGIRQFTVGTGGAEFYGVATLQPNSERLITGVHGVLALGLDPGRYSWAFIGVDGSIVDAGRDACHGPPPPNE
jgi:hypothetical protein